MDTELKEQLLERFRACLEEAPELAALEEGVPERQTDLYALFAELVALKNEVRLESRQVKTALDEFRAVFETVQVGQTRLGQELDRAHSAIPDHQRAALKPLLLELLELRDRFEAGLRSLQNYQPTFWVRALGRRRRERDLLQALAQGQEISLRRLDQLLGAQQVAAVEAEGRLLDPHTMRAAELDERPHIPNGVVTEELRKGYLWRGELLRLAEVRVNRRAEPPPAERPAPDLPEPDEADTKAS